MSDDRDRSVKREALAAHSDEAEQSVLGGLMIANDAYDRIMDLKPQHFFVAQHNMIFTAIRDEIEANRPVDVLTLAERLAKLGKLEAAGGIPYLHALAENTPSAANIRLYADIVIERSIMRSMSSVGIECVDMIRYPQGRSARDLLDAIQGKWMSVGAAQADQFGGFHHIQAGLSRVMEKLDQLSQRADKSDVIGVATGFVDLDHRLSGFMPGDLIVLAARPSMGKTAMAVNIAEHVAVKMNMPVGIFTMEMSEDQIAMRILASLTGVNSQRLRVGNLNNTEWDRINFGLAKLTGAPIFLDEQGALSVGTIRTRARRLQREHGQLGLIVVDYLQLMSGETSARDGGNRSQELSDITRGLKALAKELRAPVLALSQLNRSLESRPNKRPVMSDLRESGAIEQDADVILFIYRDEVYNEQSSDKGTAEIIISKQRNGPIGTIRLSYRGDNTRFANLGYPP